MDNALDAPKIIFQLPIIEHVQLVIAHLMKQQQQQQQQQQLQSISQLTTTATTAISHLLAEG
jgi:hypothetical protein